MPAPPLPADAPERDQASLLRAAAERDYLLAHVRCLLWRADVSEENGRLVWRFSYVNEDAAWRYFPLRDPGLLPDGSRSFAAALRRSRVPEDRERIRAYAWAQFQANESYAQEYRVYGPGDSGEAADDIRWLRERVEVRPIGGGRWEATGVTVDATEQRLLEEERLSRERALAEARVRALSEYFSVASHELRTPITTLSGYCQLLLRRFERDRAMDREALAGVLRAVERQSSRLTRLIEHLLDADRLAHGRLRLDRAWTDLDALARRVVEETSSRAPETPIRLILADASPAHASVDSLRLEQVLVNLLDNALRHGGGADRPADVTVEDAQDGVRIIVRDRGPGVPPLLREAIFERFRQTRPETYVSGLGLGLFVSREIVELHGGWLRAEDPEDGEGGVRFTVWLPTRPETHEAQ